MSDQPEKKPPSFDWARAGATFAPIAVLVVIVGIAPLPAWAVVVALTWLALSLVAWLGTLDAPSRAHIARSLNEARFTQLYTFTAGRQLKLLWWRFCDNVPNNASLLPTVRASCTPPVFDAGLKSAMSGAIFLPVLWWILGYDVELGGDILLSGEDSSGVRVIFLLFLFFMFL
ncbi:MAG: hypothetical protein RIB45_03095 [Marivibrio sp.]|uniref:hypothetical protein n=1 Tax=Marivibrio sp. TaxID=2039719 RepID=UPI0032ED46B7